MIFTCMYVFIVLRIYMTCPLCFRKVVRDDRMPMQTEYNEYKVSVTKYSAIPNSVCV